MLTPAVAVIDIATATMTTLETGPNPRDVSFVPPLGDRLLVQAETPTRGNSLTVMDPDGSNPETLVETTPGFQIVGRPDISPDGGTLAYAVWDVTARHGRIRLRDLSTGAEGIIGDGPRVTSTIWPRFSPDGTKIVAEQWVMVDGVQRQSLVVIDTITDVVITVGVEIPSGAAVEWSPDGRFLVVSPLDDDRASRPHVLVDPTTGAAQPAPWDATSYPSWQRLAP